MARAFQAFFFAVFLWAAYHGFSLADERDDKRISIVIRSPSQNFAINSQGLKVNVAFAGVEAESSREVQVRLLMDDAKVGSYTIPRKTRQGSTTFIVDISAQNDRQVKLQAILVRLMRSHGDRDDDDKDIDAKRARTRESTSARSVAVYGVIDRTPPTIIVASPVDGQIVSDAQVTVRGSATDNLSGIATVVVHGIKAAFSGSSFGAVVSLRHPVNAVEVSATDRAGNTTTVAGEVLVSSAANTQPLIRSIPPTTALVGREYSYSLRAASGNPASTSFQLSAAPRGMVIDGRTNEVIWTPESDQVGSQDVEITATNAYGTTTQKFLLSVFDKKVVASAFISASRGGVISVSDASSALNGLSVSIAPNALAADTTLQISELSGPNVLDGAARFFLRGFSIDPDGTLLSTPATIALPYDTSQFARTPGSGIASEKFLGAYFWNAEKGMLEGQVNFSVDSANKVISGSVGHFSIYFVANTARLCAPRTPTDDCPFTLPVPIATATPVVLVHGFQKPCLAVPCQLNDTLGTEATWGNLRSLLGGLGNGDANARIDAYRFDWDSSWEPFEFSAARFSDAIDLLKIVTGRSTVVAVAHSLGGILTRTYLQGQAITPSGLLPYHHDVSKLMTVGTPHTGIGGDFSTLANACTTPVRLLRIQPITCFETNTGNPSQPGEGQFLTNLNARGLPPELTLVLRGRVWVPNPGGPTLLADDDGLITTQGSQVPIPSEIIPGLCHSSALFGVTSLLPGGCPPSILLAGSGHQNLPEVEINDKTHVVWNRICDFLGVSPSACKPQLYVTALAGGVVVSVPSGINCGDISPATPQCAAGYDPGTNVVLAAVSRTGFKFDGWSGACSGTSDHCSITIGANDTSVTASFSPVTNTIQYSLSQVFRLPGAPTFIGSTGIGFNNSLDIVWPRNGSGGLESSLLSGGNLYRFRVAGSTVTFSEAFAINDRGQIIGTYCDSNFRVFIDPNRSNLFVDSCRIFLTTVADVILALPIDGVRPIVPRQTFDPDGQHLFYNPNGINNHGDVTGFFEAFPDGDDKAFKLSGGGGSFFFFLPNGARFSYGTGINDGGDIVGFACPDTQPCGPYVRFADGTFGAIPSQIDGIASDYAGINNAGRIVGNFKAGGGFVISGSDVVTLPAFGDRVSILGINNAGQILGSITNNAGQCSNPFPPVPGLGPCHFIASPH